VLHKTIKKVSEDIESFKFNTAVSALMILGNAMESAQNISRDDFKKLLQILAPFAPHITEELWSSPLLAGEVQDEVYPSFIMANMR
jgi:leucyl-tRNA synthetase